MKSVYTTMMNKYRYRMLSAYTYDADEPRPIRSERCADMPTETDVCTKRKDML